MAKNDNTGMAGMFSSMFGGGNTTQPNTQMPPPRPSNNQMRTQMKGPSDIDNIMEELETNNLTNNNDRLETMSIATQSEISEFNESLMGENSGGGSRRRGRSRKTMNI
jgi:hypothetical protein